MPDLTTTPGVVSGANAFRDGRHQARRRRRAHGLRQLHHHRAAPPRGPRLLREGRGRRRSSESGATAPGGSLPMNTNGGGLSYTHPGMYGMFLIVEAVRQLRGEAGERQVDGAEIAVAHGSGMVLSCMSTARARHGGDAVTAGGMERNDGASSRRSPRRRSRSGTRRASDELLLQWCAELRRRRCGSRARCAPAASAAALEWRRGVGSGEVYACTVEHPPDDADALRRRARSSSRSSSSTRARAS